MRQRDFVAGEGGVGFVVERGAFVHLEDEEGGRSGDVAKLALIIVVYTQIVGGDFVAVEDELPFGGVLLEGLRLPCDAFQCLAFGAVRASVEDGEQGAVVFEGVAFGVSRAGEPFAEPFVGIDQFGRIHRIVRIRRIHRIVRIVRIRRVHRIVATAAAGDFHGFPVVVREAVRDDALHHGFAPRAGVGSRIDAEDAGAEDERAARVFVGVRRVPRDLRNGHFVFVEGRVGLGRGGGVVVDLEDEEGRCAGGVSKLRLVVGVDSQIVGGHLVAVEDELVFRREVLECGGLPRDILQRLAFCAVRACVEDGEKRAVVFAGVLLGFNGAGEPFAEPFVRIGQFGRRCRIVRISGIDGIVRIVRIGRVDRRGAAAASGGAELHGFPACVGEAVVDDVLHHGFTPCARVASRGDVENALVEDERAASIPVGVINVPRDLRDGHFVFIEGRVGFGRGGGVAVDLEDEEGRCAGGVAKLRLVVGVDSQVVGGDFVTVEDEFVVDGVLLEGLRLPCDFLKRLAFGAVRAGVEDGEEGAVVFAGVFLGFDGAGEPFAEPFVRIGQFLRRLRVAGIDRIVRFGWVGRIGRIGRIDRCDGIRGRAAGKG